MFRNYICYTTAEIYVTGTFHVLDILVRVFVSRSLDSFQIVFPYSVSGLHLLLVLIFGHSRRLCLKQFVAK